MGLPSLLRFELRRGGAGQEPSLRASLLTLPKLAVAAASVSKLRKRCGDHRVLRRAAGGF